MSKQTTVNAVKEALMMTGMVIPISEDRTWAGWQLLCRQVPGQEKAWLAVVDRLLHWIEESGSSKSELFIARRYLLKDGKMVFGWFIRLTAASAAKIPELSTSMIEAISAAQLAKAEVPEVRKPLPPPPPVRRSSNSPSIRVIQNSRDSEGRIVEVTEMPLPHVKKDLNIPSKPVWSEEHGRFIGGEKGAKLTGGG